MRAGRDELVAWLARCREAKRARDAEWTLWATVPDLAHLRELVAWFCEGRLSFTPGHGGPRDPETVDIGDALAHANRSGFLTTNSQNGGENEHGSQWRADVEGLADDTTAAQLRGLVAGTRLCMQVAPLKFFRQDGTVPGSHQKPDGTAYGGNQVLSWRDIAEQFYVIPDEVLAQVTRLNYVQIVDPRWGPTRLLWDRLRAPDWDHPPAPIPEDHAMPAHIPPGREHLWRRQDESDARLAQREAAIDAAEKRRNELVEALGWDDPLTEDADRDLGAAIDAHRREHAINERIYSERLAGLTSHLDADPTAPICPDCQGTGGPPGHDAHGACDSCRGWGREYREPIPVWSAETQQWINPATGRAVDLFAPTTTGGTVASIAEVRAGIGAANDKAQESMGALQQAHSSLEQAQGLLMRAVEGSGQADAAEASGLLQQALGSITEVQQQVQAAIQAAEGVANRL